MLIYNFWFAGLVFEGIVNVLGLWDGCLAEQLFESPKLGNSND